MKLQNKINLDSIFDPDIGLEPENTVNISPVLIRALLEGGVKVDKIKAYLESKGLDSEQVNTLLEQSKIYQLDFDDPEKLASSLLIEALNQNKLELAYKVIDMLNKIKGKYNNEIKVDSNEPIKITFG